MSPWVDASGFEWDEANADKNWERHRVSRLECEEVFFSEPFLVAPDARHSATEPRFYGLGRTKSDRGLFVVSTMRGSLLRVISARPMNRRERRVYDGFQEAR